MNVPQDVIDHLNRRRIMPDNINLNTVANIVTAVCAVLIAIKVL